MSDYTPLDLSALCNAGVEVLNDNSERLLGRQSFQGLPFLIGSEGARTGDKSFIALDGASASVTVPVKQTARNVIFAHRLLESEVLRSGTLGTLVAEYVVRFDGGEELRLPVRERFEIGVLGDTFQGVGAPYRAVSDTPPQLIPRYEGRWEESGRRQTEVMRRNSRAYYLWAWRNPTSDKAIESIEIIPNGLRFILAGITLGQLDEHPFVRQGRREAKIVLADAQDADKPFSVEVGVDRGVATYTYPLPQKSGDGFLADDHKGFGEALNAKSSPAFVEIAATPSATLTVKQGGQEVGKVNWGEVERKGAVSTPKARIELLDKGRNWVHVTVLDDDTGRPVPCRVHFRSPEGVPYQPHGHHNFVNSGMGTWHIDVGGDIRLGQISYACIDGTCQGWLPRGEVIVDVARGFEYEPLRAKVSIAPGQRELTLRIKRWTSMNAQRWFSGDSHVHFLSTQGSHLESQCEDLNIVNLLQSQWGSLFTDKQEFTGRVSRQGDSIVYVGQENRQHFMGHMILWGLQRPVMPWCSDGPSEAEMAGVMQNAMSHWADQAHAQGGSVIIPHFPNPNGEPPVLIATGRVDAVEMIRQDRLNHLEYYRYLNCGYRIPLVGGTDKMSNEVPVGLYRTYAYIPEDEEFTYDNWRRSVALGRTFMTGGPIVHLSVEGKRIGDTLRLSGPGTVEVEAWAESVLPIHRLEIVQAGRVVASAEAPNGTRRLELKERVRVDGHSWLAARCGGPGYYDAPRHHDVWNRGVFAHTSPIYVACGGEWDMFDTGTAQYMLTMVEGGLAYIAESTAQYPPDTITHHHGESDHLAYLQRPFIEAREAIHRRMHEHGAGH